MTDTPAPGVRSGRRRPLTARRLALIAGTVVALAGAAVVALIPLQYWNLTRLGFDYACSASVGAVPPGEGELVSGYWSWWPLGAACEWTSLDGSILVDRPDWSTTAVAITGVALLLAGLVAVVLALLLRRRTR
ncbi:hypothetical protein SAMN06295885_0718 [Rathayibacter oskolensis]|uniref:Transmembrane protein n=1 Tax=Rathayibacter oskolensis TaxID=1891671 RepID=A0A1X7N5U3_9MICO|nr:hypothetical protein [Rathayibacter oskolensis]SMH32274.1 hypothetical protein SAMN06295885_0718 [Rathayibacter oskolensis]